MVATLVFFWISSPIHVDWPLDLQKGSQNNHRGAGEAVSLTLGHFSFAQFDLRMYFSQFYSCPSLVVRFLEELISRTFLDENQFRLVSQDRVRSQNRIGCLVFVSRTVLSCLTHSPLINAECQEDSIVFLLKRPKWISHRWNFESLFVQDWSRHSISDKQRR